jgi:hypothetical protein
MTELFPVAQAILAAFRQRYDETLRPGPFVDHWQGQCLAAALRAIATGPLVYQLDDEMMKTVLVVDADDLLAIADEL